MNSSCIFILKTKLKKWFPIDTFSAQLRDLDVLPANRNEAFLEQWPNACLDKQMHEEGLKKPTYLKERSKILSKTVKSMSERPSGGELEKVPLGNNETAQHESEWPLEGTQTLQIPGSFQTKPDDTSLVTCEGC